MVNNAHSRCAVCDSPFRDAIVAAHLSSEPVDKYGVTHRQVRTHVAHSTDASTAQALTEISSAQALAARMQQVAAGAEAIMLRAVEEDDGRLALMALREVRATLAEMSKLGERLAIEANTRSEDSERPDLDARIEAMLDGRTDVRSDDEQAFASRGARPEDQGPRMLGPGQGT